MIIEDENVKIVRSKDYNYNFSKQTGYFERWGKTLREDPKQAPMPEILDLEISQGKCMGKCPECYKCNGDVTEVHNMDFQTFRKIFHKIAYTHIKVQSQSLVSTTYPTGEASYLLDDMLLDDRLYNCFTKQEMLDKLKEDGWEAVDFVNEGLLTQIAFGICDIGTNPDFFKMMRYCREFGVLPNYTCHGIDMTDEYADLSAELCGAVAISVYNKDVAYNAAKKLTDRGMKQVNFHCIAHDKSYNKILSIIDDMKSDERLAKVNALVLLRYKPKGNGKGKFNQLTVEQYKSIITYAIDNGVSIGFDSCSAPLYLEVIKGNKELEKTEIFVEPCESSLFSSYINCKGEFYACSFCEGEGMWQEGIDTLKYTFFNDVWNHTKTRKFRETLLKTCRNCPMFNLGDKACQS